MAKASGHVAFSCGLALGGCLGHSVGSIKTRGSGRVDIKRALWTPNTRPCSLASPLSLLGPILDTKQEVRNLYHQAGLGWENQDQRRVWPTQGHTAACGPRPGHPPPLNRVPTLLCRNPPGGTRHSLDSVLSTLTVGPCPGLQLPTLSEPTWALSPALRPLGLHWTGLCGLALPQPAGHSLMGMAGEAGVPCV